MAAGATLAGMTNCDEFGMGSATAYSHHGPTFNPHSALYAMLVAHGGVGVDASALRRAPSWLTPGGSSGGSAVAVATGAVDAALGSDTGGSVRQPAAFCGVVGFKPSYGRVPRWGLIPYACSLDTLGVFARSVHTAQRVYAAMAGPDARDDVCAREGSWGARLAEPPRGGRGPRGLDLRGLRVGLPAEYHVEELDAATVAAWHATARALAAAGAEVLRVSLPHTAAALPAYYVIAPAEAASNLSRYDGVRYGHRAGAARGGAGGGGAAPEGSPAAPVAARAEPEDSSSLLADSPAAALHEEYTRSRTEGFGPEARARVLTGNYVLSAAARSAYYDAACEVRRLVTEDFDAVFRPASEGWLGGEGGEGAGVGAAAAAAAAAADASPRARGRASRAQGVDVLLAPTAPAPPWASCDTASRDPLEAYSADVLTVPASLAGLPALSLPVARAPYPQALLQAAWRDARGLGIAGAAALPPAGLTLPIGLQVIGRHLDERAVLSVAAAIEEAVGWQAPAWVGAE